MQEHVSHTQEQFIEEESSINLQRILATLSANWGWFAATVVAALLVAFLYLRYSTPQYKAHATVLVQDDKKGGGMPDAGLLDDLGLGGKSNVDNEVEIFKSRTLMEKVVRDLQLNVHYYTEGRVKTIERYNDKSFQLFFVPFFEDSIRQKKTFTFQPLGDKGFELKTEERTWKGTWNDTLLLPIGKALFSRTYASNADLNEEYTITVSSIDAAVAGYMSALSVAVPNKQVSTIDLTLETPIPAKGEVVLNKLIEVYMQSNVDDKNRIADSTMSFIDDRLVLVSDELTGIEKDIENFKEASGLTDLSAQSQALISNTSDYLKQLSNQQVQLSVLESLQKYLNESDQRVVPASLIVQDPSFAALVTNYNNLQLEREKLLMSSTENNPLVKNLDQRLANVRIDLKNSLASLKRGIQASITQLEQQTGVLTSQLRAVPAKERVFLEKSRQQSIKQELFLFLLKKREETAVSKSATIANARIVDPAKTDLKPFKPKKQLIYLSAFLIGIIIPGGLLYLKDMLNTRVVNKTDITDRTGAAIIGEISHSMDEDAVVVREGSRSVIAEQFRSLRTNLQFMLTGNQDKIILTTSSMSGEGKSFIATNLAATLAVSGKKVVLLELDLRKPKISATLGIDNGIGFSTYAIGQADVNALIQPSGLHDSLWVIPAGPVPPNPAELLLLPRVGQLFALLREHFDYIVIDTAPVGLVTDAQLLAAHADIALFIVRQGYTYKQQVKQIEEFYRQRKLPKLSLVVNDVKAGRGYGYGYGYGSYGYGAYGNGYFENGEKNGQEKKGLFQRMKGK